MDCFILTMKTRHFVVLAWLAGASWAAAQMHDAPADSVTQKYGASPSSPAQIFQNQQKPAGQSATGGNTTSGNSTSGNATSGNTANTPADRELQIFGDPLESIWKKCVFDLCGVKQVHRRIFSVVITSSLEQRDAWLRETGTLVATQFPAASLEIAS